MARRPPLRVWAAAVLAACALLAVALRATSCRGRPRPAPPDVLLVTLDTLRADRLGCYGYAGAATPVLDALAGRGVRFATAVAHAPLTTPSHASILTGLTPLRHGVRDNVGYALPEAVPTLAEAFRRAGYRTAAFVSGFPLDRRFGLGRGFETYDDRLPHGGDPRRASYVERAADRTTQAALLWIEAAARPWFAWVHYFDPHAPYEPPADVAARFPGRPYDGEIAFVDAQLGALLRRLEERGSLPRTLTLVTADHGESLGEHGEETHGVFIYDATLRVPWIVAGPGVPDGRVARAVARGIDVAPTLLDLAGIPPPASLDGRSLGPSIRGEAMPDAPAYVESLFTRLHLGWAPLHGWRTGRFKLIAAPRTELYALDTDAGETTDLAGQRADVAAALQRELRAVMAVQTPAAAAAASPDAMERMRALGYLGGSPAIGAPSLRDPKDGIDLVNRLERGLAEARANPPLAVRELTAVLDQDPRATLARRYRAIALSAAGRHEAALADLRALERQGPLSADDLVLLAETLRIAGRPAEALAALETAARRQPGSPEAPLMQGRVLRAMSRNDEAAAAYRRVLALVPGHAEAVRGLGELALEGGDLAGAAGQFERILAADPGDVGAMVKLGVTRVRAGRLDEALAVFRSATLREPGNAEALVYLAAALAKSGRPAEAVPYFERALEAGGRTTAALNGLGFARLEAGDRAGALDALRASLALEPRQAQVAGVVAQLARGLAP